MEIKKTQNEEKVVLALEGRLDTTTAPQLEAYVKDLEGVEELTLDFDKLTYISSAGLRVLLAAQKIMEKQGSMKLQNVCADIMEVFDITGFADILDIE